MTHKLLDLVEAALRREGYAGLYNPDLCACPVDDLSPNSCISDECVPGYRLPRRAGCEFCSDEDNPPCIGPDEKTHWLEGDDDA